MLEQRFSNEVDSRTIGNKFKNFYNAMFKLFSISDYISNIDEALEGLPLFPNDPEVNLFEHLQEMTYKSMSSFFQ